MEEIALVGVSDAATREDAMVVSLQHADVARKTVPGTGRGIGFAGGTESPAGFQDAGQND